MDILRAEDILLKSDGTLNGVPILIFDELNSTNDYAKALIEKENVKNALIIADFQTCGRGRVGHTFFSPKGTGIYMSYIFTPDSLENAYSVTTKAAVCVAQAIEALYAVKPSIKWVNDIYLEGRKVCGILTEAVTNGLNTGSVVVGIGINFSASALPDDLKAVAGFLPAKENVTRNDLIAGILKLLTGECSRLSDIGYIDYFRSHSLLTGTDITYFENGIQCFGHVIGISDSAGLIITASNGTVRELNSGEVFTLRPIT